MSNKAKILAGPLPCDFFLSKLPKRLKARKKMNTKNSGDSLQRLIESNKTKLANLEEEWSILGHSRPIIFEVIFEQEDKSDLFTRMLRTEGFEVNIFENPDGYSEDWTRKSEWVVEATRTMQPTAENVSHWENWIQENLAHVTDVGQNWPWFEWKYPRKASPKFSLENDECQRENAKKRAEILFGRTLADSDNFAPPFRCVPSEFLRKARKRRPVAPEATATKFAQWIYSLYAQVSGSQEDREQGEAAEEYILNARRKAYSSADNSLMRENFPDWRLVHNGLQETRRDSPNFIEISDLTVAGKPLRVCPDLFYVNQSTRAVIIVEIKHSRISIPQNLWPNIWGQLWCYAQIEKARNAPEVTVIGEVWGDKWTRADQERLVRLRASVRRNPRAMPYDRFFRSLFDIYRGID